MKRHALFGTVVLLILMPRANAQKPFTLEQVMSAPFPSNLTAAKNANRIAWVLDQEGRRNIWVAEGPAFTARQLTKYNEDDGQELLDLRFSSDSNTIVYVRGEGKNAAGQVPNPTSNPAGAEQAVWTVAWNGGEPKRVDFVRQPAEARDTPQGYFLAPDKPHPWAIWVADASKGSAKEIWRSSATPQGSFPEMAQETGGGVINWAADNQLVIASEEDGWQHLYALSADSGTPKLLTPGNCEVEQWSFTPDKKTVLFNSNCNDVDRRHLWRVSASGGEVERLTTGEGLEWSPMPLGDGQKFAYLGSDAKHSARVFLSGFSGDSLTTALGGDTWPKDFPSDRLVTPQQAIFKSSDGLEIHGQLFVPAGMKSGEKRPALIFLHGGPVRQMLLGWHYMYYYSNSYAMNQYLASRGYIVLALNYRSGIGYGRAFREAPGRAGRGATEYQDVVAAGKHLQGRSDVDAKRIGLWGGSYGGYLTALGLGRNSDLFAAGVDLHGVHDWPTDNWEGKNVPADLNKLARDSSPVTSVNAWKSPVLFIHGDDDRNVYFTQTVDLVARLREKGVEIEQLVFADDVHDFLLHRNWLSAYHAASDFFDRHFKSPGN